MSFVALFSFRSSKPILNTIPRKLHAIRYMGKGVVLALILLDRQLLILSPMTYFFIVLNAVLGLSCCFWWLSSFLCPRPQSVHVKGNLSKWRRPAGLCNLPFHFLLCTILLGALFADQSLITIWTLKILSFWQFNFCSLLKRHSAVSQNLKVLIIGRNRQK